MRDALTRPRYSLLAYFAGCLIAGFVAAWLS